jgi:SAM-dependent methyltransferase
MMPEQVFASAVEPYARYRTGYPAHLVDRLAALVGLERDGTAVDVGCGSGQLAIPLAAHAGRVIAIDPLAGMLEIGRAKAEAAGLRNITWLLGDSSRLDQLVPRGAHLATFAASFHWTDRAQVVRGLDRLLDAGAHIVTINNDLADADDPDWVRAVNALRVDYLGEHHTDATDRYTSAPISHHDVLAGSPFSDVERLTWAWERQLTVEDAVGLQFTYSFSTPAVFGDRAARFAADARAAILALHPTGIVTEPFRMEVLVASRP